MFGVMILAVHFGRGLFGYPNFNFFCIDYFLIFIFLYFSIFLYLIFSKYKNFKQNKPRFYCNLIKY